MSESDSQVEAGKGLFADTISSLLPIAFSLTICVCSKCIQTRHECKYLHDIEIECKYGVVDRHIIY